MHKKYGYVEKIALSAMLVAISAVVSYFTKYTFNIAGALALRVSFGGSFLHFTAVLFGPVIGGAAGAVSDMINFMLKPEGGFMPQFTVVAFFKGASIGVLWLALKRFNLPNVLKILISIGIPGLVFTTVNTWIIWFYLTSHAKVFMVFWTPRVIEQILITVFDTYVILAMLRVYEKTFGRKA